MIVGTRIAQLQNKRDKLRLFGVGLLPLGMAFKNTTPNNGGTALGMIFGAAYDLRSPTSACGPGCARPGWT